MARFRNRNLLSSFTANIGNSRLQAGLDEEIEAAQRKLMIA
jgi:hypothetical protein